MMRQPIIWLALFLLTAAAALAFSQSSGPASARRSGVITGRVLTDDGQPAADAQIIAFPAGGKIGDQLLTTCDEEGNFKLTSLRSGAYVIHASSPGYVTPRSSTDTRVYRSGENVLINMVKGGVITGRVTDALGEPVVGVGVQVQKVRDLEGRRGLPFSMNPTDLFGRRTDDRGIYRIYGLEPGVYLVKVSSSSSAFVQSPEIMGTSMRETPTYYPSSTYDTAVEITIRGGEELTGIDIRHRNERGFVVSGTLAGELESANLFDAVVVALRNPANGNVEAMTAGLASGKFAIYGVSNGEYEIFAFRSNESNDRTTSIPRRVAVRGADVGGIELRLLKLGSIGGRVMIETASSAEGCVKEEPALPHAIPEDISLRTQRSERGPTAPVLADFSMGIGGAIDFAVPINKGDFVLKNLDAGRHRILADLPGENYYVRSVTQTASAPGRRGASNSLDVTRNGILLRQGESVAGVKIVIAPGAASLRGRVAPNNEGQANAAAPPGSRMRIHLIPAEAAAAEEVQRYYESITRSDNSFAFKHLAPGKYLMLARPVAENEPADLKDRPVAWDATERAKLRREADGLKNEIELKPCARVKDYVLRY
jgi:Carboxypeptidase regulatory-like domain